MDIFNGAIDLFHKFYGTGDAWMHPIAAAGAIGYSITFYKIFFLLFIYNIGGKRFTDQVMKLVISGQFDRAIKYCNAHPLAILPKVLRSGLTRHHASHEIVQSAMEESAILYLPKTTKYFDLIAAIANVATMLGLLGTIAGMIEAFHVVAQAPPDQRGEMLGQAISVSMNCTMFGLIVAIPLLFFHGVMVTLADKITADVEFGAKTLLNHLSMGTSTPHHQQHSFGPKSSFGFPEHTRSGVHANGGGHAPHPHHEPAHAPVSHGGTHPGMPLPGTPGNLPRFKKTG